MDDTKYVIGIDEAGRGPLAGPLAIGFVAVPSNLLENLPKIKDSKKLSYEKREKFFNSLKNRNFHPKIFFQTAFVTEKTIDNIGLTQATRRAIGRGLKRFNINKNDMSILLDGALFAPKTYTRQETIIRGDENVPIIAMASIVAKVRRDRKMIRYAKRYPEYSFEEHKGYGTEKHRRAIKKHGICDIHRRSFLSRILS